MTDRFQFSRINEITGTFVLVVVAALIAAVVWTGRSQRWFKSNVTLRILLPADGAAGIRQGSDVYFLGTRVGSVSDVLVDTAGRMEARTSIRQDFFRFVRTDSSAVVKRKFGVAGDSFFEVSRGIGRPLPEENASIRCNEQFQSALESAIEEIRREALIALKKTTIGLETWNQLGAGLGESRGRLDQLVVRLERIATGIESGHGTVGALIARDDLAEAARDLLAQAHSTMHGLQSLVTNLHGVVQNVADGTARLPEITDAVATEVKDLPGLVQHTQTSVRELQRVIEAMERHWLLRRYMAPTNPPSPRQPPGREDTARLPRRPLRSPKDSN